MSQWSGYRILLGAALVTLVAGCSAGGGYSDLDQFMTQAREKPRGHVDPLPQFKAYESFTYSAADRRSPFEPPIDAKLAQVQQQQDSSIKPDFNRPKEPLEDFDLKQLKMVGTLRKAGGNTLWALVSDGQGGIHRVRLGNHMGKSYGRVVAITDTHVDIVEIVPNGHGGWVERPRTLNLEEGKAGGQS